MTVNTRIAVRDPSQDDHGAKTTLVRCCSPLVGRNTLRRRGARPLTGLLGAQRPGATADAVTHRLRERGLQLRPRGAAEQESAHHLAPHEDPGGRGFDRGRETWSLGVVARRARTPERRGENTDRLNAAIEPRRSTSVVSSKLQRHLVHDAVRHAERFCDEGDGVARTRALVDLVSQGRADQLVVDDLDLERSLRARPRSRRASRARSRSPRSSATVPRSTSSCSLVISRATATRRGPSWTRPSRSAWRPVVAATRRRRSCALRAPTARRARRARPPCAA